MNRFISVASTLFLVLAAVGVPLTALPPTVSSDITITFYGAKAVVGGLAILAGWIALFASMRSNTLLTIGRLVFLAGVSKWITVFVGITMSTALVSDVGLSTALLGNSARLDGALIVIVVYHISQIGAAMVRKRIVPVNAIVNWVLVGGIGVAVLVGLEASGFYAWSLVMPGLGVGGSPVGPIGRPGGVTAYFAVLFVVAVIRAQPSLGAKRWANWVAATMYGVIIGLHMGRAGVGAAVLSLCIVGGRAAVKSHSSWRNALAGLALLLITITSVQSINDFSAGRLPGLTRAITEPGADLSIRLRMITWELGVRSILANPLKGTGTGSFADQVWIHATPEQAEVLVKAFVSGDVAEIAVRDGSYLSWYDPERNALHVVVLNYDKSHNYFLDIGIHSGVLALLSIIAFWASILVAGLRSFNHHPELLAASIAYLITLQAWFININVDPALLLLIVGLAGGQMTRESIPSHSTHQDNMDEYS